jgi:hypothetical protein
MQNWKDLYLELCEKIAEKEQQWKEEAKEGKREDFQEIRWFDLWHNQVYFLETEHPFPAPAVFLAFRGRQFKDTGDKVQDVTLQVDVYLFFETFTDTYFKGVNQESALSFIDSLDRINAILHGSEGENYSSMRRIGLFPVDTGSAGNLYQLVYECTLIDFSAQKIMNEGIVPGFEIEKIQEDNQFKI